jgi:hypothetical protein
MPVYIHNLYIANRSKHEIIILKLSRALSIIKYLLLSLLQTNINEIVQSNKWGTNCLLHGRKNMCIRLG